jgi:hypothetical protein
VQVVAQQIPCSQRFVWHSLAAAQVLPLGFLVQAPITQTLGAAHSASFAHEVRQTSVAQVYCMHGTGVVV